MNYPEIATALIEKFRYQTCLCVAQNAKCIECKNIHLIQPNDADDFFFEKQKEMRQFFDIAVINSSFFSDSNAYSHIVNTLSHLNEGGALVIANVLPIEENEGGFCWKAVTQSRAYALVYEMESFTIDCGGGITVFKQGRRDAVKPKLFHDNPRILNWDNYCAKRNEWLNIMSLKSFDRWLNTYPLNEN